MRTLVVCVVFLAISSVCNAASVKSADSDADKQPEVIRLKKEISRLNKVLEKKNTALDMAIREIKKCRPGVEAAVTEPPDIIAAFSINGWEQAEFVGIGIVSVKNHSNAIIVKVSKTAVSKAMTLLAAKSSSHFVCGDSHCFVLPKEVLVTKVEE